MSTASLSVSVHVSSVATMFLSYWLVGLICVMCCRSSWRWVGAQVLTGNPIRNPIAMHLWGCRCHKCARMPSFVTLS
ncbi:hypothetical protein HMPREF3223_00292 [Cutibacterium avidum]|nr:hypothetical protein HMPREF3223_00292 [Cutibacterium avidum]